MVTLLSCQLTDEPNCRHKKSTRQWDNSHTPTTDANMSPFFMPCASNTWYWRGWKWVAGGYQQILTTTVWLDSSARWIHFYWVNHSAIWHVGALTRYPYIQCINCAAINQLPQSIHHMSMTESVYCWCVVNGITSWSFPLAFIDWTAADIRSTVELIYTVSDR